MGDWTHSSSAYDITNSLALPTNDIFLNITMSVFYYDIERAFDAFNAPLSSVFYDGQVQRAVENDAPEPLRAQTGPS